MNRRELRKQSDQAERPEAAPAEAAPVALPKAKAKAVKTPRVKKAPAAGKVKKPRARKAPTRMRARWGVFDNNAKQVAVFDYNDRGGAEAKLADLLSKKKSTHFMQIVKDAMPEPVVIETPLAV